MLLWFQGFDYLPERPSAGVMSSLGISGLFFTSSPGRFGAGRYSSTPSWVQVMPTEVNHGFLGFASRLSATAGLGYTEIAFVDVSNNTKQFIIRFYKYGIIKVFSDGVYSDTILGVSDIGVFINNVWQYIEIEFMIAKNGNGFIEIRVNTKKVLSLTGITTQKSPSPSFRALSFTGVDDFDDFYLCDDQGPPPLNTFLGNVRVQALMPAGPGDTSQFNPSAAGQKNWQCVSGGKFDDTLYVSSPTTGSEDSYAVAPLINSPQVFAVQTRIAARQDDASQRFLQSALTSGGTKVFGPSIPLSQSYAIQSALYPTDPATGVSWQYPAVNALRVGQKVSG